MIPRFNLPIICAIRVGILLAGGAIRERGIRNIVGRDIIIVWAEIGILANEKAIVTRSYDPGPLEVRVVVNVATSAGAINGRVICLVKLRAALVPMTTWLLLRASTLQ